MKLNSLFVLFILFFSFNAFAVINHGEMNIYAVTTEGEGVSADLIIDIAPGTGKIFTSVEPLVGTSTQTTQKIAVNLGKRFNKDYADYDYFFQINSGVSEVTGPSAGAAMALLVASLLSDKPFPENVSVTGTITEEGFIGAVGGVYAKTKQAAKDGKELFLIPKGEALQTVKLEEGVKKINLIDYAPAEFGVKVLEVSDISEALDYAFSDLSKLDVNVEPAPPFPEFTPEPILVKEHLLPFKQITQDQLNETEKIISDAKKALSNSLIKNGSIIASLIELLENAEESFNQAKNLNESNYLYSAANYSFLAKINALTVKEISMNPELLESDSSALNEKLSELNEMIFELEQDLNQSVPANKFEWFVTAQERLSYAKQFVERLSSTHTVVVGGDKYDSEIVEILRVKDYEFAKSWFGIASAFYQSSQDDEFIVSVDLFEKEPDELIEKTQKILAGKKKSEAEDIYRRLDAAIQEKEMKWHLGSLFDAASAYGLVLGNSIDSTDSNTLKSDLTEKISLMRQEMNSSDKKFLWAEVYLDHAEYFLLSGNFYLDQGYGAEAIDSYKSGLSIALLAEQMFLASDKVKTQLSMHPELIFSGEHPAKQTAPSNDSGFNFSGTNSLTALFLAFILFLSFLVLSWEAFIHSKKHEEKKLHQIHAVNDLIQSLDESHAKGFVEKKHYEQKVNEYKTHLENLRKEVKDVSIKEEHLHTKRIALIDSIKSRINALKQHYFEGIIKKTKYEKEKSFLEGRLKSLEDELKKEETDSLGLKPELIDFDE
ncbi:MAG: S16 family serine protease [Candidatus Diapherotrites archaeon]